MTDKTETVAQRPYQYDDVWDYIVIGAGSSGCVVANRLSESGNKRVLVLEAGHYDNSLVISLPSGAGIFDYTRFDWGYHSLPDSTRNQKSEHWPAGRVVGGSSSINGMNYVRGSASDFDRWAGMGNDGWAAKDVMPLFHQIERCDRKSIPEVDDIRGREGPLHVKIVEGRHPVTQAFIDAAQSAGYPFNSDYNAASQEGIGYCQATQRRGRRWSAADAYLKPALRRRNLKLAVDARVHKLLIKDRRVRGVLYEQNGTLYEARAQYVILSAGVINTPKLLMLSGIGDAKALSEFGIGVVLDRAAVGQNLMDHPLIRLEYRVNVPTYNLTGGLLQKASFLAKYLLHGQGPLSMFIESIAFLKTSPKEREPDVQVHFSPFGWGSSGWDVSGSSKDGPSLANATPYPCVAMLVNKNHPVSRGQIRLASADPKASPLIEPRLLDRDEDVETLVQAVTMVRRIVAEAPMAKFVIEETLPGNGCANREAIYNYIRHNTEIAAHFAGTCRMGVDEAAVVTPDLQVKGIENLWIADASIMPDLISSNINAACIMIGEKLGRMLTARSH